MLTNYNTDGPGARQSSGGNAWTIRLWEMGIYGGQELPLDPCLTWNMVLIILLEGEASMERNEQVTRMAKGTACFCPPNSTFGIRAVSGANVSIAVFQFSVFQTGDSSDHALCEGVPAGIFPEGMIGLASAEDRVHHWAFSIYQNSRHQKLLKQWRAQVDFQEMLYEILETSGQSFNNQDKTRILEKTRIYMEEHYGEDLTTEQLAGIAELSPKYFAEVFKKTYGSGVMEFLTQIRMNKAKQLMLGTDRLLREVAHQVGYRDEFYFSRKFKKEFGLSPSAYMKTHKNKLAVYGSSSILGYLIPLEVTPYAAPLHPKWSRYYHQSLAPIVPVHLSAYRQNHNKEENLQKLSASQPDLILCATGVEPWEKERLKEIAPIYEMKEDVIGWQAQLYELADLLGRTDEAGRWLEGYNRKRADVSRKLRNEHDMTLSSSMLPLRFHKNELCLNQGPGINEVLFGILGFMPSSFMDNKANANLFTTSHLVDCDADHLWLLIRQDTETLEYWKTLQSSPEWMGLPAVRAGRVHVLSSYPWREYSPIAILRMLEEIEDIISVNNP
ncbi:AraC family transcriptional regulator [Paenibacillus vini]|uniref:AraC family transcriptional regulator n=1 Tax=Paenibacillus vini TaxID=1476024 RepID=UPI0025B6C090|nr:AraC family transcriptional regulator [Paenibacillus vini]MDN4068580.1 AraC family transcriptional regulator [Paenibacillus vini]